VVAPDDGDEDGGAADVLGAELDGVASAEEPDVAGADNGAALLVESGEAAGAAAAGALGAGWPGKRLAGRSIFAFAFEDFDDFVAPESAFAASLLLCSSKTAGSNPLATASWRARKGLRPLAISRLTEASVGVLWLAARAAVALAALGKLALQPGTGSTE
jgi:hypothetical protein